MALAEIPGTEPPHPVLPTGASTDGQLLGRALDGEVGAFEELYRRHADAAYRVGCVVAGNRHDAADAVSEAFARVFQKINAGELAPSVDVRSYVLTATRNAAIDTHRRGARRHDTAGDDTVIDLRAEEGDRPATPADALVGAEDAALIARAFADLPERWRSVLWLTEVEGLKAADAADQLGLSANNASQLAHRARQRLRERYLQAHVVAGDVPDGCRFTLDRLGAYVGGGLSARDVAKLDQHLADCEPCRARQAELDDVGAGLRRMAFPLPVALAGGVGALHAAELAAGLGSASSAAAGTAATGGSLWSSGLFARLDGPPKWLQTATAGAAAALLVAGIGAVVVHDDGDDPTVVLGERAQRQADGTADPATVVDGSWAVVDRGAFGPRRSELAADGDGPRLPVIGNVISIDRPGGADPGTAPAPGAPGTPGSPDNGDAGEVEPLAQLGAGGTYAGSTAGVTAGVGTGSETGVQVGPLAVGDAPPTTDHDGDGTADDGLVVETGGSLLPGQQLTLP